MRAPRRICVFTGSRAEYGILVPILRRLQQDDRFHLSLVAAGTHFSLLHGETYRQIESDGFRIDARIEMVLASDSPVAVSKSIGLALIDFGGVLDRLRPDLLMILGDRFEILAAAIAATVANVPVAHVHGGEITRGAFDDQIRHAVTKLSHLHFTATEEFRRRVIQMGESPDRVFVTGAPAVETIRTLQPMGLEEVSELVGRPLEPPVVVVAYHPATLPGEDPEVAMAAILAAVRQLEEVATVALSFPNADPRYAGVQRRLREFAATDPRAVEIPSIGHRAYLSLLSHADLMVGNSSAGLIEAPAVGLPVVNVGERQRGRPQAASVLNAAVDTAEILERCRKALSPELQRLAASGSSPYDLGVSSASLITEVLDAADLSGLLDKEFHEA